jgi:hypothetical protein
MSIRYVVLLLRDDMFYAIVLKYCQRVFEIPYLKVKPSFAGNAVLFLILDIETTGLSPISDYTWYHSAGCKSPWLRYKVL